MNANLKNKFQKDFFIIFTCEPVYLSSTEKVAKSECITFRATIGVLLLFYKQSIAHISISSE